MLQEQSPKPRYQWLYPALLAIILLIWCLYMGFNHQWALFLDNWAISLTMLFGSFIAGATPQGGAAVAFPVFTKVLKMPPADARTFGLMIQAIGMTMASVMIFIRGVKILPKVLIFVTIGGVVGLLLGTFVITIPNPFPRILFTLIMTVFGGAMIISRWVINARPRQSLPMWCPQYQWLFIFVGVIGGVFSAQTGSGADTLTFIVLTLAFGINEKISTPTTVIIMGLNSVAGFLIHALIVQDVSSTIVQYWLVAMPIVIFGAPLGAFVLSKIGRDPLIFGILILIVVELISTLILIPINGLMVQVTAVVLVSSVIAFWAMLRYRAQISAEHCDPTEGSPPLSPSGD